MRLVSSGRVRRVVLATFLLGATALSLAGLNLVRQSLDGRLFDLSLLLALLPFAIWSFGLRALRWHVLAGSLKPGLSPLVSGYVQVIGFSFSVTPGRVAELYKLKVLERSTGLTVAQSLPAVFIERLTDAIALGLLVAVGGVLHWSAAANGGSPVPLFAAALGLIVLVTAAFLSHGHSIASAFHQGIPAWVPFGTRIQRFLASDRVAATLAQLKDGGIGVTRPSTLALALLFVILGRLGDGVVLWKIGQAVGYPIPFALAMLIMGTTGLVGGVSLAPGGLGAAEAALAALIVAHGVPLAIAIGAAFSARALLFWLWVVLGLGLFAVSRGYDLVTASPFRDALGPFRLKLLAKRTLEREG
jgi:glycosyltransferase 2 family protein